MKSWFMSFKHAFNGINLAFKQRNFKIQLLAVVVVIGGSQMFNLPMIYTCVLLLCIGLVLGLEIINSSIEALCDTLHPERAEGIKQVKDMAAGAVLIGSIIAALIGVLVFSQPLLSQLQ